MDRDILLELALVMGKLSLLSLGDVTSILAQMEREVVGRGWMSQAEFLQAYSLGQLIPGPVTLFVLPVGYLAAGVPGAATAFLAFFVPPALLAVGAMAGWGRVRHSPWPNAVRVAIAPVAVGLMVAAVWSLGRVAVRDVPSLLLAGAMTLLVLRTRLPTPLLVLAGAVTGALLLRP